MLKPGGFHLLTVHLTLDKKTVKRVEIKNKEIIHLLPPEYHNNSIRSVRVLCFMNYGYDIIDTLESVGFSNNVFDKIILEIHLCWK